MTTRDVLEKIMRGKKSAKQAFEDFCKQEGVSGIVIFTGYNPVILLKDEFANRLKTGGSKGNGLTLTTDKMQFYKGYEHIDQSISAGLAVIRLKHKMIIATGGAMGYQANPNYNIVETADSIYVPCCEGMKPKLAPTKIEIVNTIDNPVNVNITNEDEDVTEESYEDEDYFSDEDDDD